MGKAHLMCRTSSVRCSLFLTSALLLRSVLKTRIQTLKKGLGEDTYNGVTDCAR